MNDTPLPAIDPLPAPLTGYITNVMPSMEGWCTAAKAEALMRVVLADRPRISVELGVFGGRSLIAIALAQHINANNARIFGVDPWSRAESVRGYEGTDPNFDWWARLDHDYVLASCTRYCSQMGVMPFTTLVRATSDVALPFFQLPQLVTGSPYISLLHVDANHTQECALADVNNYVPLVTSGGVICLDDVNWSSTGLAQVRILDFATELFRVESEGQACAFYRKR